VRDRRPQAPSSEFGSVIPLAGTQHCADASPPASKQRNHLRVSVTSSCRQKIVLLHAVIGFDAIVNDT